MSSRTAERNKAIRLAWEREQKLVQEGNGTRDWTKEQQTDILNPDKGKAYDEEGRAFQGQHMKSAAEYPEYAGNPDNIQFLTRDEHLEAHKGSWQNPTNWYYDPVTKEFTDFGDGAPIPCKPTKLSDPIAAAQVNESEVEKSEEAVESENTESQNDTTSEINKSPHHEEIKNIHEDRTTAAGPPHISHVPKHENGFVRGIKTVGKFIINHPAESLEIAGVVFGGVAKIVSSIGGRSNNSSNTHESNTSYDTGGEPDIGTQISDIVEKANRASPHENDVPAHKQRYHTKNGIEWRDKAPYHRGGKDK